MGSAAGLSDGRAELCGGAFAARQENGARPATAPAEIESFSSAPGWRSGGRGKRRARVGANALDHRAQAIGALRREVLAEAEFVEHRDGIR